MYIFIYIFAGARLYGGKLKHIGIPIVTTIHKYVDFLEICYTT